MNGQTRSQSERTQRPRAAAAGGSMLLALMVLVALPAVGVGVAPAAAIALECSGLRREIPRGVTVEIDDRYETSATSRPTSIASSRTVASKRPDDRRVRAASSYAVGADAGRRGIVDLPPPLRA